MSPGGECNCAGAGIGLIVETTGKQQTEAVNRVISELLGTFLQQQCIPQIKALGGLSFLLECEIWS